MTKQTTSSLTPDQINDALDACSPLRNPFAKRRFLAELKICIEWANKVADPAKPRSCFRYFQGLKFRPETNFPVMSYGTGHEANIRGFADWMFRLHIARCEELGVPDAYIEDGKVDLAGGRLVVMQPTATTSMGVSSVETNYLLDVDDVPPIGLWVAYVKTPEVVSVKNGRRLSFSYFRDEGYILSYIPEAFVESVQAGIDVNAEDCIFWLEDLEHVSGQIIRSWI